MRKPIVKTGNSITVGDGEDHLYLITRSGWNDEKQKFIVIDLGPHFNGTSGYASESQLEHMFANAIKDELFVSFLKSN